MVGREVEILPGYSLLFTWRGKKKLFELLEARTEIQFAQAVEKLEKEDKFSDDLIVKMYQVGLNWEKNKDPISLEQTEELIEEYCQSNGFGSYEVREKLVDALCNSGILDKEAIELNKKLKKEFDELTLEKLKEKQRKSDKGEALPTSISTN